MRVRETIVFMVGKKWVPVWCAGVSKCTSSVHSQSDARDVQVTVVSWSQVVASRNAGVRLAESEQVSRSHVVQTPKHLNGDSEPGRQCPASVALFSSNYWVPLELNMRIFKWFVLRSEGHVPTCQSSSGCQSWDCQRNRLSLWRTHERV